MTEPLQQGRFLQETWEGGKYLEFVVLVTSLVVGIVVGVRPQDVM